MAPKHKIDLLEFARIVKDGSEITDEEFVDQMRRVWTCRGLMPLL